MTRVAALPVLLALLAGCASTGASAPQGHGTTSAASPARPGDPTAEPRSAAALRILVGRVEGAVDLGVPTPEPASPHLGEPRFAGPTPQVPIPVMGRPACW
jgi:hypothetical protein